MTQAMKRGKDMTPEQRSKVDELIGTDPYFCCVDDAVIVTNGDVIPVEKLEQIKEILSK